MKLGDQGGAVWRLQQLLSDLGFDVGAIDGVFGPKTESAVLLFQSLHGLYTDGVAGSLTQDALEKSVPLRELVGRVTDRLLPWVQLPADKYPGRKGYTRVTLREDVSIAYRALYQAAHDCGGLVTSSGGRRALSAEVGSNRSAKSLHYLGRAFDLAVPTGLKNPATDPYVIVRDGNTRRWTVWCASGLSEPELADRCTLLGIRGGLTNLDGTYLTGGKVRVKTVLRNAFCFMDLARIYGFHGIPARPAFFSAGDLGAAEWWHFQWEAGLVKGQTTFGSELLRSYTHAEVNRLPQWDRVKDCRWGVDWA